MSRWGHEIQPLFRKKNPEIDTLFCTTTVPQLYYPVSNKNKTHPVLFSSHLLATAARQIHVIAIASHSCYRLWRGKAREVCLVLSARFARLQSEKITPVLRAYIWTIALFIGLNDCVSKANCETYPGDKPFTEIETQTVAAYLKSRASELVSFFDIHSYSQLWMAPWGNKNGTPAEYNLMVSRKTNYSTKKKSHLKARTMWGYPLSFEIRNSAQEIRNPAP